MAALSAPRRDTEPVTQRGTPFEAPDGHRRLRVFGVHTSRRETSRDPASVGAVLDARGVLPSRKGV